MTYIDDAFCKLGLFSEAAIEVLIDIAGGIPNTFIEGKRGEEQCPPRSRREAARAILNFASRHSAGTTIRIDGKELSPTRQRQILDRIKNKSKFLSRDIKNIWNRDNWNLSCHFAKHGIRDDFECLIYLLDSVHSAAESALQDLEPIKKKKELTNASKTARAEFISALFKVWENIFEKPVTRSRTKEGRPSGKLVEFIVTASKIANLKPELNAEVAYSEIEKRIEQKK